MAFNEGVIIGPSILNGGAVQIGTDNAANGITIGTGTTGRLINIGLSAAPHTIVMGNTNTTTSMSLQSGTGNTVVNSAGTTTVTGTGGVSINSISGTLNLGDGANANAINIGTGAAARTITVGNTTSTTAVNIDIGTGDFTLDSGTGNIMTALDTGEINYPLQPAFLAYLNTGVTNQTGAGAVATVPFDTEVFDQNGDFASNTFTAPVTGRYTFQFFVGVNNISALMTSGQWRLVTSNRTYITVNLSPAAVQNASNICVMGEALIVDVDAADTVTIANVVFNGAGNTAGFSGLAAGIVLTAFSGSLLV